MTVPPGGIFPVQSTPIMTYIKSRAPLPGKIRRMERNPNIPEAPREPRRVDGWYVADDKFPADPLARLAYYARLAPSTHNSQPWKFVAEDSAIDVFADHERWLRVSDADQRELHISLGCAIEAMRIAADYAGFGTEVRYFPVERDPTLVARLAVTFGGPKRDAAATDLLKPMVTRHTSHRLFDPARLVSDPDRKRLYSCFQVGDVSLHFLYERPALARLSEIEMQADALLFSRPEYREELAQRVGEGTLGTSWLMSKLGQLAVGHLPVAARMTHGDAARLVSAPLVALLTTRNDRRVDQLQAGEAYLRIALVAETKDIRAQPVSQVLETAQTRAEVAKVFGLGERVAQHLFRLGHAAADSRRPPRRPLQEIFIHAG